MKRWDEPHGPDYAKDEPEFMAQYGRALAEWGNVEHVLAHLFAAAMKPADMVTSRAAFLAVNGFRDKISVVSATLTVVLASPGIQDGASLRDQWGQIAKSAERAARHRNELAHMHVWHGSQSGSGTFGSGHLAQVTELPLDWKQREPKVVTIKKLNDYRQGFFSLYERIFAYRDQVADAVANRKANTFSIDANFISEHMKR